MDVKAARAGAAWRTLSQLLALVKLLCMRLARLVASFRNSFFVFLVLIVELVWAEE